MRSILVLFSSVHPYRDLHLEAWLSEKHPAVQESLRQVVRAAWDPNIKRYASVPRTQRPRRL